MFTRLFIGLLFVHEVSMAEFGLVKMPDKPLDVYLTDFDRPINVMVGAISLGSHQLHMVNAAIDLVKHKTPDGKQMFNVTVLCYENQKLLLENKGEFFHLIESPLPEEIN